MCLEQEHKPRSKNIKLKSKNQKPRDTNTNPATDLLDQPNTNPATDFSCQPNTKTTNTNPNISKNTNTNPAIHLQKTCNPSSKNPSPNTNPNPNLTTTTTQLPTVIGIGIGIKAGGNGYEELVYAVSDDLRHQFPYGGVDIIDGLTDQLKRFLKDESAGSSEARKSMTVRNVTSRITDVSIFNPDPNSLHRASRSRSLTPISTRSF